MKKQLLALALITTLGSSSVQTIEAQAATIKKPDSHQVYVKGSKLYDRMTKRPLKKYAQYKGYMYKDGTRLTGTVNSVYFKKGKLGTGIYKKKFYRSGQLSSGVYEGKLYRSGIVNKEYYEYDGQLYNGAKPNKGVALFKKKLYLDEALYKGYYVYNDVLYKDGRTNTTVVQVDGAWYTGATIQPGWIRTKQLGWIKIDDFGFQIKGAVPPPDVDAGGGLENPGNGGSDMEPPTSGSNPGDDGMEPPSGNGGSDMEPPTSGSNPGDDGMEPPSGNGGSDMEPPTSGSNPWDDGMEPPSWGDDDWI